LLFSPPAWGQQTSLSQPSEDIINAVIAGDWSFVRSKSIEWVSRDSRSAVAMLLADTATSVTRDFDGRFKALSYYDYPYSDPKALEKLTEWVNSLLRSNEKNENILILMSTLQMKGYKNITEATQIFEQARNLSPDNEYVLINLGNSYGSNNRTQEARDIFENVLKKNTASAGALNGLGMIAMSRKDMAEAATMFEKAVKTKGVGPMEYFNLGSLYYHQKRFQAACQLLEKAVVLSPKMIDARFNLAGIYYTLQRKQDCIEQLKIIVEIDSTSTTGTRAKNNLSSFGVK